MTNELDLRQYMAIIRKRLAFILIFVIACSVAAAVVSYWFMEPKYEASTQIIVNQSKEQMQNGQFDLNQINTNIRMIDTYKEIITARAILDKVAEQYPQLGMNYRDLVKKISVSSTNNTQVMKVVVTDTNYLLAAETVNAVTHVFKQEISQIFNVENVTILNEAVLTERPGPISPNVPLNTAIGFVVSLMLALGVVFLIEYLDDTIKTEKDVLEILGQPTLAMIARASAEEFQSAGKHTAQSATMSSAKKSYKAGEFESVTIEK